MDNSVFVRAHNIISPLGSTSTENFNNILQNKSGIQQQQKHTIDNDFFYASLLADNFFSDHLISNQNNSFYTRFEQFCIASATNAISIADIEYKDAKTIFILSTTKGNIELLENKEVLTDADLKNISLFNSAQKIAHYFHNPNRPIVISNACISGVAAIIYAKRLIDAGKYDHVIIIGADLITRFIFSGFKSFNALSKSTCKPFSNDRDGINLGEAAATIILSRYKKVETDIKILSGSISNDANHISGPSKTGDELCSSILKTLQQSNTTFETIDFISAHGTATLYNDEMESKAFKRAGLDKVPINSLKGYFGHTLGAAGVIESIISILSMQHTITIPTLGYNSLGVSEAITICTEQKKTPINYLLKTASGFGGCNASVLFAMQNRFNSM